MASEPACATGCVPHLTESGRRRGGSSDPGQLWNRRQYLTKSIRRMAGGRDRVAEQRSPGYFGWKITGIMLPPIQNHPPSSNIGALTRSSSNKIQLIESR